MNNMNTFFDESIMLEDMDEMETSPKELEEIIGDVFYEDDYEAMGSLDGTEDFSEDAALIEDMTNLYDIEEE